MTTIAFDGKTLAADSLVCSGDMRFGHADKIIRLEDGRLLAGCGNPAVLHAVVAWLNGGEEPKFRDGEAFQGIVVHPDGRAEEISGNFRLWPACVPFAAGSGEPFALVAMRLGKSAAEAVAVACEFDTRSAGPVQVVDVKPFNRTADCGVAIGSGVDRFPLQQWAGGY